MNNKRAEATVFNWFLITFVLAVLAFLLIVIYIAKVKGKFGGVLQWF